ncbi:MAG: enoyl-CoA hydratase/isomerase family protein [Oscillospiraceae bacterium]|nr:enoyl-CoA hydratase/isomerase family protein [Oscillospiraceae bacterium]
MELQKLHYAVADGIATITMDYGKNLNAIDDQMADELIYLIGEAEKDPAVKVVILNSAAKAFSAGGDIGYFYQLVKAGGEINMDSLIGKVGKITNGMKSSAKMYVAAVNGAAAGAGFPLALSADFIIADEKASFILAFVNLGLVPDTGAAYLLCKSIGEKRTMKYAATGKPIKADEALAMGLVEKVVAPEELAAETEKFAKKLAAGPLVSYKNIKKQIYAASFSDYERFLDGTENPTQHECSNTEDFKEGCAAFMEKRKAAFQGK